MNAVKKYTDLRAWLRALGRHSIHAGTGAVISAFGTNGIEQMTPEKLAPYTSGIGMNAKQAVAVFAVSCFLAALKFIHESTEETRPPMP